MALSTVQDLVTIARTLLQDELEPYRYETSELLSGLNLGLMEARRLRPDLFLSNHDAVPSYTVLDTTAVEIDGQYFTALMYYVVAHAHLRDEEDSSDARASAFMQKFIAQLVTASA